VISKFSTEDILCKLCEKNFASLRFKEKKSPLKKGLSIIFGTKSIKY